MTGKLTHQEVATTRKRSSVRVSRVRNQNAKIMGKCSMNWMTAGLFLLTAFSTSGRAVAQNISTAAGNGVAGYSGDGGSATSAEINYPGGVAVDLNGNVYIADTSNCRIREVSTGGTISTFAGNGTCGYGGDNGPATGAELSYPEGVAVDGNGNVYIADSGNNRVREVTPNGGGYFITTVAGNGTAGFSGDGGLATSAEINYPIGVGVDLNNNLYIADTGNNRVREVPVLGTRTISTFAGNGSSTASGDGGPATSAGINPVAVTVSPAGNMYITDQDNNRIREVIGSTISTAIGSGEASEYYCGPAAGGLNNGVAPGAADLSCPSSVTIDAAGNIYIADTGNQVVKELVASTNLVNIFAGTGTGGYNGDGIPATSAELYDPDGVAVANGGPNLNGVYIADEFNSRIRFVP